MKEQFMISVNPPFSNMIQSLEKKIEFRKRIIIDLRKGDTIWFYETKNKGGCGRVIGQATLVASIPLSALYDPYSDYSSFFNNYRLFWNFCFDRDLEIPYAPTNKWVRNTRNKMQEEYLMYSNENNKEHLEKIGISGNFAILFEKFIPCNLELSNFISVSSDKQMLHPPQNMCRVKINSKGCDNQ